MWLWAARARPGAWIVVCGRAQTDQGDAGDTLRLHSKLPECCFGGSEFCGSPAIDPIATGSTDGLNAVAVARQLQLQHRNGTGALI